ncbi:MAG: hypothetical protein FWD51_01535 [Betaproteobacteria bacterium]|nr:hypothetical protein [Betaproteobacteria bacterium]
MCKAVQKWQRLDINQRFEQTDTGRLFASKLGQVEMDGFRVIHSGLDTVRQLYKGQIKGEVLAEVVRLYTERTGELMGLGGHVWLVRSGGKSGYQYMLQNSDLGLIVFLKSRFTEATDLGSHLKIECSPHWIHPRPIEQIASELDRLAACLLDAPSGCGVAVHICADMQGWHPAAREVGEGSGFLERLKTRARRLVSHKSNNVEYFDIGEVGMQYGHNQSYLLGSASSVQLAVYRKDLEATAKDKLHFWQHLWEQAVHEDDFTKPAYVPGEPVWRVEFRFHQSVLEQFARGFEQQQMQEHGSLYSGLLDDWMHIAGVSERLTGLWRYGLENYRLEVAAHGYGRYYDPAWQILIEDVIHGSPAGDFLFKRVAKKPGEGNTKNLMLAVGNLLSCYARNRYTPDHAYNCLKASGIYDDLFQYMFDRACSRHEPMADNAIRDFITKGLLVRTLLGKAA